MGETLDQKLKEERDLVQELANINARRLSELEQEERDLRDKINKHKLDPQAIASPEYQEEEDIMYEELKFIRGQKREITGERRRNPIEEKNKVNIEKLLHSTLEGLNEAELEKILSETKRLFYSASTQEYKEKILEFGEEVKALMDEQKNKKLTGKESQPIPPAIPEPKITDPTPTQVNLAPLKNNAESKKEKKRIEKEFTELIQTPLNTLAKDRLERALAWLRERSGSVNAREFKDRMLQFEKEVAKALQELPLRKVRVGTLIMDEGETFRVIELPNAENKGRYLLKREDGIIVKPDKSLLLKKLEGETPPTKAEVPSKKAEAIEKLRDAIKNSQRILEENRIKRVAILARIAELEKTPVTPTQPDAVLAPEVVETKIVSTDFMKEIILPPLREKVSEVKNFELKGAGKEITLDTTVVSWGGTIKVQVTFENKGDDIVVKNYKIDAIWPYKGKAEKKLLPYLNKVSEELKKYAEKQENKKIKNILIKDGQLEVTF